MAESLVKTGWADALCSQVYDEYEHSTRINLRAETYYGVFGLNRQELAAVSQSKKSFREVDNALEWREAGLAINGKNMAMTANIRKLSGMAKTLQESGMTRSLKYLRQQHKASHRKLQRPDCSSSCIGLAGLSRYGRTDEDELES